MLDTRVAGESPGQRTAANSAAFLLSYLEPGMSLLDCGCGPGSITVGLAVALTPGQVVGLDASPGQLAAAQRLAGQAGVDTLRFEHGSVYALPFPDGSFDAV